MLKRTVNFLRGTVRLEAEGPFPERVLNLCAQNQVLFWGVEWLDQTRLRLNVTRRSRAPGRSPCRRSSVKIWAVGTF